MRMLFLNHNVAGTGTYQRAYHLGRELARRGHAVTLVTTSRGSRVRSGRSTEHDLEIIEAPDLLAGGARNGWDPWNTFRRIRLLDGRSFDLVHAFDARPVVIGPALAVQRTTGATLFMDWADWWGRGGTIRERSGWLVRTTFGPVETWFEEAFRTRAAGCTVISAALSERAAGLGVAPERITRIPNGCVPPEEPAGAADDASARRRARAALGLAAEPPLIVHVGTALPGDADVLFEAMATVGRTLPAAKLALVGGYRGRVPEKAAANGRVIRTGFVPRAALASWVCAADVCVIPLRDNVANRGRWPGKVNEYLAAGRATVMSRVGDAAETLAEWGAGWVCAPGADALAAALIDGLRDEGARASAEARSRELARTALAWPRLAASLEEFHAAVVEAVRGGEGSGGGQAGGVR